MSCLSIVETATRWILGSTRGFAAVLGLIHNPHPAAIQLLNNSIMKNCLADHWNLRSCNALNRLDVTCYVNPDPLCIDVSLCMILLPETRRTLCITSNEWHA